MGSRRFISPRIITLVYLCFLIALFRISYAQNTDNDNGKNQRGSSEMSTINDLSIHDTSVRLSSSTINDDVQITTVPVHKSPAPQSSSSHAWVPWVTAFGILIGIGGIVGLLFWCFRRERNKGKKEKKKTPSLSMSLAPSSSTVHDEDPYQHFSKGLWASDTFRSEDKTMAPLVLSPSKKREAYERIKKPPPPRIFDVLQSDEKLTVQKLSIEKSTIQKLPIQKSTIEKLPVEQQPVSKLPIEHSTVPKLQIEKSTIAKLPVETSTILKSQPTVCPIRLDKKSLTTAKIDE